MNYQFLQTNSVIVGENRDLTIKSVISYNAEFFFEIVSGFTAIPNLLLFFSSYQI